MIPAEVTVILNDDGQAMLVSVDGWPMPPPDTVEFHSTGSLILIRDGKGGPLGGAQVSAAPGLLTAREVFLGDVANGAIRTVARVKSRWR
jgi:hypothetical protein